MKTPVRWLPLGILSLFLVGVEASASPEKPHIVYILADDLGVGDLSCLNPDSKIKTVELDRLAAEGTVFTDAHSGSSVCTPTRYGLLTGRHSWRTTLKERVLNSYSPCLIPRGRDTVASLLKRHGYQTAMIGKWHLGLDWAPKEGVEQVESEEDVDFGQPVQHGPLELGFDYWYGCAASWDMAPYAFIEDRRIIEEELIPVDPKLQIYPYPAEYLAAQEEGKKGKDLQDILKKYPKTAWRSGLMAKDMKATDAMPLITQRVVEYIEEYPSEQPLFLYVPYTAPHTPVVPRDSFLGKSGVGTYGDFVLEVDWSVGEIVKALKARGMFENTLLVFTADNGASIKAIPEGIQQEHGHDSSYVYSGWKGRVLEGGHRVPFIATWPGVVPRGQLSDAPVSLNDLYATCAEIVGEERRDDCGEDSFSMVAELQGKPSEMERVFVHQSFPGDLAIRVGDWKLSYLNTPNKTALINLRTDIEEVNNLIDTYPEKAEELRQRLARVILEGRSTPGVPQGNEGERIWEQIRWMEDLKNTELNTNELLRLE